MKTASMIDLRDRFTNQVHDIGESETVVRAKDSVRDFGRRWAQAFKAIRALVRDPEDTEQVFKTIAAISGKAIYRAYLRFGLTKSGQEILDGKIQLLDTLKDRGKLAQYPDGSLARAYLEFTKKQHLTADGLVTASDQVTKNIQDPKVLLFSTRIRDSHDLWHTLTGYNRDVLGEACLLAFTYAQTRNKGAAVLTLVGAYKLHRAIGSGVYDAIWQAYRDGKRATWLPAQRFEQILPLDIELARSMLTIPKPVRYWQKLASLPKPEQAQST